MKKEEKYYEYDYWFNNKEHDNCYNFGEEYYVNKFYKQIVFNLDIPKEGHIVVLGSNRCISFNLLCDFFGKERCIGYDLYNPTNHPKVIIKDCLKLSEKDNIPIAFCHNDLGNFSTTPQLKSHAQKWAVKNIIKGGHMLGNNNLNRYKWKIEEHMIENGFINIYFKDLDNNKFDLTNFSENRIEGYMISKKI